MTWLPVETGLLAERDVVLGLKPDVYEALRETLTTAWQITDSRLLDLCRLRLAQMLGARAEMIATGDERLLVELEDWRSSPAFSERERAALSYAEQYSVDHSRITVTQKEDIARHLSPPAVVNFVWALHMNDSYARVLSLLDIEPDPPSAPVRLERFPAGDAAAGRNAELRSPANAVDGPLADIDSRPLMAPEFSEAYRALGRAVVRQTLVDETTSEAVRLHNASHQGCRY
jgi:alkylhydroperoxidase family enzyme